MKCALLRVDTGQPFVAEAALVANSDGSVSFALPDGRYAGQEPNRYGVRHDGDGPQQYQRATLTGSTVTFVTRPQDVPMIYLFGQGSVYPA